MWSQSWNWEKWHEWTGGADCDDMRHGAPIKVDIGYIKSIFDDGCVIDFLEECVGCPDLGAFPLWLLNGGCWDKCNKLWTQSSRHANVLTCLFGTEMHFTAPPVQNHLLRVALWALKRLFTKERDGLKNMQNKSSFLRRRSYTGYYVNNNGNNNNSTLRTSHTWQHVPLNTVGPFRTSNYDVYFSLMMISNQTFGRWSGMAWGFCYTGTIYFFGWHQTEWDWCRVGRFCWFFTYHKMGNSKVWADLESPHKIRG